MTLEFLEADFYSSGLKKLPPSELQALGLGGAQIQDLSTVGEDERIHAKFLSDTIRSLGSEPVQACTYSFDFSSAKAFLEQARVLEAVGVAAYLGAAPLIGQKFTGAAASILTVEARHHSVIRNALGVAAVPSAFDVALSARQVFTLASPFIVSCPKGSALAIPTFDQLSILNTATVRAGSIMRLAPPDQTPGSGAQCAFASGDTGLTFVPLKDGSCVVPKGLTGEVFVALTTQSSGKAMTDDEIIAG